MTDANEAKQRFYEMLRIWWSFDDRQQHTHSWHSREDFIENVLPDQLDLYMRRGTGPAAGPWNDAVEACKEVVRSRQIWWKNSHDDLIRDKENGYLLGLLDALKRTSVSRPKENTGGAEHPSQDQGAI